LFFRLVNAPGTAYRYPSPPDQNFLWAIGELNPVYNVEIETNGLDFKTATLPLRGGAPLEIVKGRTVILPELRRHEVVELTA